MSKIFKVKEVGLDTSRIDYTYTSEVDFDCIHTSISANNDHQLCEICGDNTKLVTSIGYLDNCLTAIMNHLEVLGRKSIDILLIDAACDFDTYGKEIQCAMDNKRVLKLGIQNPESADRIQEVKDSLEKLGLTLEYVALDICPVNFDHGVIKYCEDSGIPLIGFNPFGGYINAPSVISSFGKSYLLNFISAYCDMVFLSAACDYYDVLENIDYTKDLQGKEASDIYELKKSIKKLQKPLKKAIYSSIKFGEKLILPYEDPQAIYDYTETIHNLGKETKVIDTTEDKQVSDIKDKTSDLVVADVLDIIDNLYKPADSKDEDIIYLIRGNLRRYFKSEFPEGRGWYMTEVKLGDKLYTYGLTKETKERRFFSKDIITRKTVYFVLYYSAGEIVFENIDLAAENPSKPK